MFITWGFVSNCNLKTKTHFKISTHHPSTSTPPQGWLYDTNPSKALLFSGNPSLNDPTFAFPPKWIPSGNYQIALENPHLYIFLSWPECKPFMNPWFLRGFFLPPSSLSDGKKTAQKKRRRNLEFLPPPIIGFLRGGGCPSRGGNWGTLRIPKEDWGALGNIRKKYEVKLFSVKSCMLNPAGGWDLKNKNRNPIGFWDWGLLHKSVVLSSNYSIETSSCILETSSKTSSLSLEVSWKLLVSIWKFPGNFYETSSCYLEVLWKRLWNF